MVIVYVPGLLAPAMKAAVRLPGAPTAQGDNIAAILKVGFEASEKMHTVGPVKPDPVT